MSDDYIDANFQKIKKHENDIEKRVDDGSYTKEWLKKMNHLYYVGNLGIKDREAFNYCGKELLKAHHLYVCPKESKELIQVACYWSYNDVIDYEKFRTVVESYKRHSRVAVDENIDRLIYGFVYNELEWIYYNQNWLVLCKDMYEAKLAKNEVLETIGKVKYKISQIDKIVQEFR